MTPTRRCRMSLSHDGSIREICSDNLSMQILSLDIIGTHLQVQIDTSSSCDEDFSHIRTRLQDFEARYSRFIEGNWLDTLNKNRTGTLDLDAQSMLTSMLDIARRTLGYFDPTVGKRLSELGY